MCSQCDDWRPRSLSHGSVGVNSPLAPRLVRGQGGNRQPASHIPSMCVCVAAAHSVLFDSTGLIRHPAPWQRQDLNSSVKSLSTQTHAHSPQRRRERIESSQRGGHLCRRRSPQCPALTAKSGTVFPAFFLFFFPPAYIIAGGAGREKRRGGAKRIESRGRIVKCAAGERDWLTGNASGCFCWMDEHRQSRRRRGEADCEGVRFSFTSFPL